MVPPHLHRSAPPTGPTGLRFHRHVECEETATGCRITHRYEFRFRGPFRVVERILGTWLQDEIEAEVAKVKTLVEAS